MVCFQPPSLLIGKVWVPVIHILFVSYTLQSALQSGKHARIVQIDFIEAFHRVNHQGILYKLCPVGIGGSVLSVLTQFLSNRSQHVMEDGCRSKLIDVVRSAAGPCFGPVIVPPVDFGAFFHSGKYADRLCK